MRGYIYRYFNPITNKSYIGQTTDLPNRKSSHKGKAVYTRNKFYNAVRKYGWETFEYSIVTEIDAPDEESCTKVLDFLEIMYIAAYDSYYNGYNSTPGGKAARGMKRSEEYKEYCRNRIYSSETRAKMSQSAKNRMVSNETREKCRANAIRRNFASYREQTTEKRNLAIKKALGKPILQIASDGEIINEFSTIREAVSFVHETMAPHLTKYGIENALIRHCKGKTKKEIYYGFVWKYKTNV